MASRGHVLDWLHLAWRGAARDGTLPVLSDRCSTLAGRAQLAQFLAESSFRPRDPLPFSGADAVACELSREAVYWALLALREQQAPAAAVSPGEANSPARDATTLATLWAETERELLDRAAGGREEAERLRADLLGNSFAEFAELSPGLQAATAARLHAFAERLIEPLAIPQRAQERAWVARLQLLTVALVVLVGLGFVAKSLKDRFDLTRDLAPSASWKASSLYNECWCESPAQSCEACPNFFFHTEEENKPSVVFDLHRVQSLSGVEVENRRDCCFERALPLIVQVSSDEQHWKTVATRRDEFTSWRASFPSEQARWVKLSVGRRSFLHLSSVRLLP
ncbi:MAG: discoidin domain-containing protein [Pseudomonadota bacterium]